VVTTLDCVGGGGSGAPGQSICPANAERASVNVRTVAAQVWRRFLMFYFLRDAKILHRKLEQL